MSSNFWLSDWLKSNDLNTIEQVTKSLTSPAVISDLRHEAEVALRKTPRAILHSAPLPHTLLAGRGLDLSAQLTCRSDICRRRQVDELFTKVWHYFDRIIVHDDSAPIIIHGWEHEGARQKLLSNIKVLFYLREIGAETLVEFKPKPSACTVHFDRHAREAGLSNPSEKVNELVEILLPLAQVKITQKGTNPPTFSVRHPLLEVIHQGTFSEAPTTDLKDTPKINALTIVARRIIAHLTSDVAASHMYHAPLGATLKTHAILLENLRPSNVADVVLNLNLPVLEGLEPWDLIEIRRDEQEYFDRFRDALTKAIKEQLKISPVSAPDQLAQELREDLIEPRLRDISARLQAAQRTMTKKSAVGLFLGAISTTCGILSGIEPNAAALTGTGVAIACTGVATAKYLDENKDITLDDMYFLWKAAECVPH